MVDFLDYEKLKPLSDCFIYCHTNKVNGKKYIGQTTQGLRRLYRKINDLKRNECNSSSLQNAINKYGFDNFITEILCYADTIEVLNELEEIIIKAENTLAPNGYNLLSGGFNNKPSDEFCKKVSEQLKGKFTGKNASRYGKKHSMKSLKKMAMSHQNSTGILRVHKKKKQDTSQGFTWVYQYYENGIIKRMTSVDLFKLKSKVEQNGLPWKIIDPVKAEQTMNGQTTLMVGE